MAQTFGGGGGSAPAPKTRSGGPDALQSTIVSQLLGVVGDNSSHTTGHPGYTISHAADRSAAQGRFNGYQSNAKTATKAAVNAVTGRNKGIKKDYSSAATAIKNNAAARDKALAAATLKRDNAYAHAADALGLAQAPDMGNSRSAQMAAATGDHLDRIAASWQGLYGVQGKHAVERNNQTADAFRYGGLQQQTTLDGLLERVLASMPDQVVASTLGSAPNVSQSSKMSALRMLQQSENAANGYQLDQQRLLGSLGPKVSETTQYGSHGQTIGSSKTVRR